MPSWPCRVVGCTEYVREKGGACADPEHQASPNNSRHAYYDRHHRNPVAKAFYASARWLHARDIKLQNKLVCERCEIVFANTVHHIIPLEDCTYEQQVDQNNLMALCGPCHSQLEAAKR